MTTPPEASGHVRFPRAKTHRPRRPRDPARGERPARGRRRRRTAVSPYDPARLVRSRWSCAPRRRARRSRVGRGERASAGARRGLGSLGHGRGPRSSGSRGVRPDCLVRPRHGTTPADRDRRRARDPRRGDGHTRGTTRSAPRGGRVPRPGACAPYRRERSHVRGRGARDDRRAGLAVRRSRHASASVREPYEDAAERRTASPTCLPTAEPPRRRGRRCSGAVGGTYLSPDGDRYLRPCDEEIRRGHGGE